MYNTYQWILVYNNNNLFLLNFHLDMEGRSYEEQVGMVHYYHVYYEGCLTNFEIGEGGVEASQLYPDVNYTTVEKYMKRYL